MVYAIQKNPWLENVGMENAIRVFINQKLAAVVQAWEEIENPNRIEPKEIKCPRNRSNRQSNLM